MKRSHAGKNDSPLKRLRNKNVDVDALSTASTVPSSRSQSPFNTDSVTFEKRLKHYNLDFPQENHETLIHDRKSRWFCNLGPSKFAARKFLPYQTETINDQAQYLCHVIINLYLAISSLDIQGLISLSNRDLLSLQQNIIDFSNSSAANSNVASSISSELLINNDIANFDEGEEDDELEGLFDEEGYPINDYSNDYIDSSGPDFNVTGKITDQSSAIINVNHWTNELKNCLNFPIPLTLRKSLIVVYYHLSLVQGQKIYRQLHVEILDQLIGANSTDPNKDFTDLLLEDSLTLNSQILFNFICEFLPYPDSEYVRYDIQSKDDLQLFRLLLKLAHIARPFFANADHSLVEKSMNFLLSSLASSTMPIVLPIMTSFIPFYFSNNNNNSQKDILHYFPFVFSVWTSVSPNIAVDTHMYDFVGSVSEAFYSSFILKPTNPDKYGKFGLFTKDQLTFLFNRVQGHLRADGQIHSYSRTVKPFVYSINGSDNKEVFSQLISLIKSIETFIHPSNNGFWTKNIAKFIHAFLKMYHKRVKDELNSSHNTSNNTNSKFFLNSDCHSKIIEIFLDTLIIGSQNKNSDVTNYYISSFAYLLDLNSSNSYLIYDKILIDIYDSLAGEYVNSRHRIIASLKQFTRIVRFMVMNKLYRVHITNILSIMISKIDLNDTNLTSNLINGIVSIATFIPLECPINEENEFINFESDTLPFIQSHFYHLKEEKNSDTFQYDNGILNTAFRASTTVFKTVLRVYIDKLFQLVDVELDDPFATKICQTTMVMIESMDDTTFKYFADTFQRVFWDNDAFREKDPNYEIITIALSALVKRDSSLSDNMIKMLIFNIKQQIERGAGSVRSSSEIQKRDLKLVLYLNSLNDIIRQSHAAIINFQDELIEFMKFIFENITNPPLDVITSIMIHSSLASLSTTEMIESRLINPDNNLSLGEKWGGLQFDERRYNKENTNFKWHVPSEAEITCAIKILNVMTEWCIGKIEKLLESPQSDTLYCDKIQKFILIITHALSGSSLLFDPEFNENKLKASRLTSNISTSAKVAIIKSLRSLSYVEENLGVDLESDSSQDEKKDFKEGSLSLDENEINLNDHADSPDVLIFEGDNINGDVASEMPSGICTPTINESESPDTDESHSGSHPSSEFKELDIFACNYHFGNTFQEKVQDPQYFEVHKIRLRIGSFFHKVYEFLIKYHESNTIMNQILLHGIKVLFTDVGQETIFNEDSNTFIDNDFLDNIQSLAHLEEPYTRMMFAVKINDFHQNRVLLHSSNRYPSRLESQLLKDIISLSLSIYPDIYKPAQGTLVHCMKQIIGSYSTIVSSLIKSLKENLVSQSYKKIEVILRVLLIKKIHRKLMTDYKNLQTLVLLLIDCLNINEMEVALLAEKILSDYVSGLKFPSSICVHDGKMFSPIKPPGDTISQQVDSVIAAKKQKRMFYYSLLENLQNSLLNILETGDDASWKIKMIIIRFISRIQSSLETRTNPRAISILFEQTKSKHPDILHLVARSYLAIFNKIFSLSDYGYDISRAYQSKYDPSFVTEMDTSGSDFKDNYRKEMNNFDSPTYFIDSRPFVGWLCWGRPMKVLHADTIDITLKPTEIKAVNSLGDIISKEWLDAFTTTLVQDNETKTVFSTGNVSVIVLMVILFTKKYTSKIGLADLFALCEKHYDRFDKASMIMSVEIFAGLICGGKYMDAEQLSQRDEFVNKFLSTCLNHELNQDSFEIWSTLCWWLPTLVDIRRCKPFFERFSDVRTIFDDKTDTVANQSSRILMLRSIMMGMEFRAPDMQFILKEIKFDSDHDQIREAMAKLFVSIIQDECHPSIESPAMLMDAEVRGNCNEGSGGDSTGLGLPLKWVTPRIHSMIDLQFDEIDREFKKIDKLTPQQVLKSRYFYLSSTMFYFIQEMARGPNKVIIIPYVVNRVLPFLVTLLIQKDVCKLAGLDVATLYLALAYLPMRQEYVEAVVDLMCGVGDNSRGLTSATVPSSYQLKLQLSFLQHYFSSQLLQLTQQGKQQILEFVVSNLYNETHVEVRDRAADVLSDIVHNVETHEELMQLIRRFSSKLEGYTWEEKKQLSRANDVEVHGSVVGLGALVSAFPYVFPLPAWIPRELSTLSSWARTSGAAGRAAKNTIAEFKKVRTDTWRFDRARFTSDELEDLEGVLWRSYYA